MSYEDAFRHFLDVPEKQYHEEGRSGAWLQSHALALFAKSPAAYDRMRRGAAGAKDEPTEAFEFGRAAHCFILEGPDEFRNRFASDEGRPINPKTNKPFGSATKEFATWAASLAPRAVVSAGDIETILRMRAAILANPNAARLLCGGRAEATVRAKVAGLNCQARIDYFTAANGITDLKSCHDLDRFERDAIAFGYIEQLGFYHAVLRAASGLDVSCRIVAVEKREPFRCGVWRVPSFEIVRAERENESRLNRLRECIEADYWPEPREWDAERTLAFLD